MQLLQTSITLTFPKQALVFTCLQYNSFENTVGKGEIARNEPFFLPFLTHLKLSSANAFSLDESKLFRLGKG